MKVLSWLIALCGLWEFGDIAALFVPGFGKIPPFVWNHIVVGLFLMVVGVCAARASDAGAARRLSWAAACGSLWLMVSSSVLLLEHPSPAGPWNDLIVGVVAFALGVWAALRSPHVTR